MLSPEETQRLQSKLEPNEQILWTGKPIPSAFSDITIKAMAFGFLWWGFLCFFICQFLHSIIYGDPNNTIIVNDIETTVDEVTIWSIIPFFAFLTPFIAVGIGMLFAPFWKYVFLKGQCYAVTNKRAIIMGRLVTRSWYPRELQFIRRDGADVHFAKATTTINANHPLVGFDDLSLSDLKAAEAALHKLHPQKFPDPNEERKKYPYAYFR